MNAFLACNVYIVCNVISNSHEVFQPVESDAYIGSNPGSHKAVPLSKIKAGDKVHRSFVEKQRTSMKSVQVMGQVVDSVTVRDLLSVTLSPSSTYIIKTDIEDLDCEVL